MCDVTELLEIAHALVAGRDLSPGPSDSPIKAVRLVQHRRRQLQFVNVCGIGVPLVGRETVDQHAVGGGVLSNAGTTRCHVGGWCIMAVMVRADGVFRERVYEIVRRIPYGSVATYGMISTLAGMPRHARQVGWALHTLPDSLVWGAESDIRHTGHPAGEALDSREEANLGRVPWHRVINSKGQVSTHPDEAGTYRQIALLREEGIEVTDDGVLVQGLAAHQWRPDPAEVDELELPAEVLYELDRLIAD